RPLFAGRGKSGDSVRLRDAARARAIESTPRRTTSRLRHASRHDLFLRSRISANTRDAGLPASPTDFATSGMSARRNGLAAFSSPMVDGIVGLRAAIRFSTCASRALSAALSGSMLLAKRILALVYSWPQ